VELKDAREQIQHLLRSRAFENSETHRRLLEYLAAKSLSGESIHLKEYTVGIEAFGKPPGYNPQEDSIVRTQAGRLRLKLLEYYKLEGRSDPVVVELPKGGFRLEFRGRSQLETAPIVGNGKPFAKTPPQKISVSITLPWVLCGILAVACIVLSYRTRSLPSPQRVSVPWPLSRVVNGRQQTTIVLPDASLAMLRFVNGKHSSLEEYLSSDYPKPLMPRDMTPRESKLFQLLTSWPLASQSVVETVKTIVALTASLGSQVTCRSAHDFRSRDLKDSNSILLGSPVSNPWVSRFEGFLNFREVDGLGEGEKYFVNTNPRPGELPRYRGLPRTGDNGWAYATVSVVPNEQRNASVMILQGLHKEGTEAAGLFLADAEKRAALREVLAHAHGDPGAAWFEVLIRAESMAATPGNIEIVAVRIIHPE
jgi:hypothetical protein